MIPSTYAEARAAVLSWLIAFDGYILAAHPLDIEYEISRRLRDAGILISHTTMRDVLDELEQTPTMDWRRGQQIWRVDKKRLPDLDHIFSSEEKENSKCVKQ